MAGGRATLLAFLLFASVGPAMAGRNHLKPMDFEPLTSLPWKQPGATLDGVAADFAQAIDDFFIGQNGAEGRAPVHGRFADVGKPTALDQTSSCFFASFTTRGSAV